MAINPWIRKRKTSLDVAHHELLSILSEMHNDGRIDEITFTAVKELINQEYQKRKALAHFSHHINNINNRLERSFMRILTGQENFKENDSYYSEKFFYKRTQDTYTI